MVSLFISHASKDNPQEYDFVCDLVDRLAQDIADLNVFFDKSIEISDHWRNRIFAGFGEADAAIVVLGIKALNHQHPWVHTEATLLRWKQLMNDKFGDGDAQFPLILLLYGQGSADAFDSGGQWEPLQFKEVQFVKDGDNREFGGQTVPDSAYQQIKGKIEAATTSDKFGYKRFQQLLGEALQSAYSVASNLTGDDLKKLVQPFIEDELSHLHNLLKSDALLFSKPQINQIVDTLSPLWVPHSACQALAQVIEEEHKVTRFALYCQKQQFTPQCYLAQPEWRTYSTHWPYIRLNPCHGEGSLDAIHQFINHELATLLQIDSEQATDSHFINQELAELRLEVDPYFVLIPDAFVHRSEDNIPDYISQHWPSLNQLLLLESGTPLPPNFVELQSIDHTPGENLGTALETAPAKYHRFISLAINNKVPNKQ